MNVTGARIGGAPAAHHDVTEKYRDGEISGHGEISGQSRYSEGGIPGGDVCSGSRAKNAKAPKSPRKKEVKS